MGSKLPNAFGLHDMHSNLWKWCQDFYDEKWYEKTSSDDPNGPAAGSLHVIRGGYWSYNASYCRAACRIGYGPSSRYHSHGFRCVRVW